MYKAQINFNGPKEEISELYSYFRNCLFVYDSGNCKCFENLAFLGMPKTFCNEPFEERYELYIVSDNVSFIDSIIKLSVLYPLVTINICVSIESIKKLYYWNVIFGHFIESEDVINYVISYKYPRELVKIYKNIGKNAKILLNNLIKNINKKSFTTSSDTDSDNNSSDESDCVENEEEYDD